MRTSSVAQHAVPPVYVCYCLRSLSKPNQTYIGSTNAPLRRIRQHNGAVGQGAVYTRFARPWVMDFVVFGFPSKLAALQFEWSWQQPHMSRNLRAVSNDNITSHTGRSEQLLFPALRRHKTTTRFGMTRTRARTSTVPESRVLALRAMLVSEPYCFWGLRVACFTEFAFGVWTKLDAEWEAAHGESLWCKSRVTKRALPPGYPFLVCDFTGVQGTTEPLAQGDAPDDAFPALPEAATSSKWQEVQSKPRRRQRQSSPEAAAAAATAWPEHSPLARDASTLGLTWRKLRAAPRAVPVTTRRRRSRHTTPMDVLDGMCTGSWAN